MNMEFKLKLLDDSLPVLWLHSWSGLEQDSKGRTDPMGIGAMPWGPPPKGVHQTSKNNANQQKSVTKKAQPSLDNLRNFVMK